MMSLEQQQKIIVEEEPTQVPQEDEPSMADELFGAEVAGELSQKLQEEAIGEEETSMADLFGAEEAAASISAGEEIPSIMPSMSNSGKKPKITTHQYDFKAAKEASEKAKADAHLADGRTTTTIAEAANQLVLDGADVTVDDLSWLNQEDEDIVFEDLFGQDEGGVFELEDSKGNQPALAIEGEQEKPTEPEKRLNAVEEGLNRLKRRRPVAEMTAEEASDLIEELLTKMTTAADDDAMTIRQNIAKERLLAMMDKERMQKGFLSKKANHERFNKLYRFADFPNFKNHLKSYWIVKTVDGEEQAPKFDSAKARHGSLMLLNRHPEQPALAKISILNECCSEMNKPTNQHWFVTYNGLSILKTWLQRNPDGSLPAMTLRTEILKVLQNMPVGQEKLRTSQIGHAIKDLLKCKEETLPNRKICQELVNKWLANVLGSEQNTANHRADVQHQNAHKATPVKKRKITRAQMNESTKESASRTHPKMYAKAHFDFKVQPQYSVTSLANEAAAKRQTRKGKIAKCAGELRALRPADRDVTVCISGKAMNVPKFTF